MSADQIVSIEEAIARDWLRSRTLRLSALADAPDAFARTFEEEERLPESAWKSRLESVAATLLAQLGGRDVGLAVVARAGEVSSDAGLYSVWVDRKARGAGVGHAMLQAAIEVARREGFRRVILEVGDHNEAAIRLYSRMGFGPTGEVSTLPAPREHITEHQRAYVLSA